MANEIQPVNPVKIVLLFHEKDQEYRDLLRQHLWAHIENGKMILWDKDDGLAGDKHVTELKSNLASAKIILILVSSRLTSSNAIVKDYLPSAIKRAQEGEVTLIPILTRSYDWESLGLGGFNPLPKNRIALEHLKDSDTAYTEISKEIETIVNKIIEEDTWEKLGQQDGELSPEIQDLEQLFLHSPDSEVMAHPNYHDNPEYPRSAAHFLVYKKMLSDIRMRMSQRQYRFCAGNLEDANNVLSIIERVGDRLVKADSQHVPSYLESVEQFKKDINSFKNDISDSDWENPSRIRTAIGKYILPFCEEIEKFEKKFDKLANSILDELPPPTLS